MNVTPEQAAALLARGEVEVVDVREHDEWSRGHLAGARLVPLAQLRANPNKCLPRDGVLFVCAGGIRSQTAARIAAQHGYAQVFSLVGGVASWVKDARPLVNELPVAV